MAVSKTLGDRMLPVVDEFLSRHPKIEVRPYQRRIIAKTLDAWSSPNGHQNHHQHVNIESPVGSGKTCIGLVSNAIAQEMGLSTIGTWTAMKLNLLGQVQEEIKKYELNVKILPISTMSNHPPLDELRGHKIIHNEDESHHGAATSSISLRKKIQEVSAIPLITQGLSGTPVRGDGMKLSYSLVIRDASARQLIQDGFLSQFDYYSIPKWNGRIAVKTYTECPERWGRSIMFFHTIRESEKTVRGLKKAGISAALVEQDQYKRIDQLADFKDNKYQVLVGCLALTEGFNDPHLKTVFLRASNRGITVQMGGRVLRLSDLFPRKQIVQPERGWSFMKYATPAGQWMQLNDQWRNIEANENVDKVAVTMTRFAAQMALQPPTKESEILAKRLRTRGARKW